MGDGAPLVFSGYHARGNITLQVPFGTLAFTCVWIKNDLVASAKTIYNVRASLKYFYDGKAEFEIKSAGWWYEVPAQPSMLLQRIDLEADESQCIPIVVQPVGATQLNPPWPQCGFNEERFTRPLKAGRWMARIEVRGDGIEPIVGEVEFTLLKESGSDSCESRQVRHTGRCGFLSLRKRRDGRP